MYLCYMRVYLLGLLMMFSGSVSAQFGACYDSTLVMPGYNCPNALSNYQPLCGCDGVTYNNSCIAEKTGGITPGNWTDGPCEDFHFYFTPNTVSYLLEYNYYAKTTGILNIFVYDVMGHVQYEYREPVQTPGYVVTNKYIDVSNLESGIYIFLMMKDGVQKTAKFFQGQPF